MHRSAAVVSLLLLLSTAGCGDDDVADLPDAGGPRDWPEQTVPESTTPEPGIRRDIFRIAAGAPAANPETGESTPPALLFTQVVRYRVDRDPPAPARAIVVAMPGFLGGGPSWEMLARHLVRRSDDAGEPIEVWAIDRRANLLEDLRGVNTAEAAGDPEIANGYYNGRDTIDGQAFPGYLSQDDVGYMSEWGLAMHVDDVRRVIELVPEADRAAHVVFAGHSLGAFFAEAYAAWRFDDGTRGFDELAGIVLIDGLLGDSPLTEQEYHDGVSGGLTATIGLDRLRERGPRYFELPIFGVQILPNVEILSLRVLSDPDAVIEDEVRDDALRVQLSLGTAPVPPMTNAAALGFGFDDDSNAITFTAVSCGEPTGGSIEQYDNAIAGTSLTRPTDPDATYAWVDAADGDPDDFTPLANLAHSFVDGASNFAEWYFPTRLPLDLAAVGGARVPEDGYQAAEGLRVFDGAAIDVPILAVATELVDPSEYDVLSARTASVVDVLAVTAQTHIDPLTAADRDDNPIPARLLQFVYASVADGTITVDVQH